MCASQLGPWAEAHLVDTGMRLLGKERSEAAQKNKKKMKVVENLFGRWDEGMVYRSRKTKNRLMMIYTKAALGRYITENIFRCLVLKRRL